VVLCLPDTAAGWSENLLAVKALNKKWHWAGKRREALRRVFGKSPRIAVGVESFP
jgi:hypothetical protein